MDPETARDLDAATNRRHRIDRWTIGDIIGVCKVIGFWVGLWAALVASVYVAVEWLSS